MHEVHPNTKRLCLRESFCDSYLNERNLIRSDGVLDDHLLSFFPWSSRLAEFYPFSLRRLESFQLSITQNYTRAYNSLSSLSYKFSIGKKNNNKNKERNWSLHVSIVHHFSHHSTTNYDQINEISFEMRMVTIYGVLGCLKPWPNGSTGWFNTQ